RCAVYENLIKADALVADKEDTLELRDVNADGNDEVVINTKDISLYISPEDGGTIRELDFKAGGVNIMNTLSRHREGYHKKLEEACRVEAVRGDNVTSIHGNVTVKEEGLDGYLIFDDLRRASLRERFLDSNAELTAEALRRSQLEELGGFSSRCCGVELIDGLGVVLERRGDIEGQNVSLEKRLSVEGATVKVDYTIEGEAGNPLSTIFTIELNFLLPGCSGPLSYVESGGERVGLSESKEFEASKNITLVDGFAATEVSINTSVPVKILTYPVETVSLSEGGFERIYQGTSIVLAIPVEVSSEALSELSVEVAVKSR
ncbi:MAG: DUF1926 domain-containing protein, partial [Deltaproteobacteria bacterium]|nr:DUF1926 domain-containing protein [Deltaproteobacteria bacterium]